MKSISEERLVRWQEHAHQLASLLDTHILPIFWAEEKRPNAHSTWGNSRDSQAVAPQPLVLMSRHLKDLMHSGQEVALCWWERKVGKSITLQITSVLTWSVTTWGLAVKECILWWRNKHGKKVYLNPWKRVKNFNGCELVTTAEAVKDIASGVWGWRGAGQDTSLFWPAYCWLATDALSHAMACLLPSCPIPPLVLPA